MNIVIIDDELMAIEELKETIESVRDNVSISCFSNYIDGLKSAKNVNYDVAFLDISMPGMNGLELATELKNINKNTNIIFVTGYSEYALDAFGVNASGYILKPAKASDVENALENLRVPVKYNENKIRIQCFGNFEVFFNDSPVKFSRALTKELFAYLINLKGSSATTGEICGILFGDKSSEKSTRHYFRNIVSDLKTTLEKYDAGDVFIYSRNSFSIDVSKVECDYYKYLEYDSAAINSYMGEYMKQYSWAELTNGFLVHNNIN